MKKPSKEQSSNDKGGRPKGSNNKMTQAQVELFVKESIVNILDNHFSWRQYIDWGRKKFKLSHTQLNKYWKESWEIIREKHQHDTDRLVAKHLNKYWQLYDIAIRKEDVNSARQVLNDIAKLTGFDAPEKIQIEQELNIKFNFGTDE